MRYVIGSIGQYVGLVFLSAGCVIEIIYKADIGFIFLTFGSLFFTVFTKIKHSARLERKWRRLLRRR